MTTSTPSNRRSVLPRRSGAALLLAAAACALVLAASGATAAPGAATPGARPHRPEPPAKATFAGGCFWCEEATFEGIPGVISVTSGYTGGSEPHPTYEQVSSGTTGHAESVEILYDPAKISYGRLLDIFWHNVDPTQGEGQFCDHGHQYRSAIFYHDAVQKRLSEESKHRLETAPQRWKGPIRTQIVSAGAFWPAEEYHQDFYRKNPVRYREYRLGCGRDQQLEELWGKPAPGMSGVHAH